MLCKSIDEHFRVWNAWQHSLITLPLEEYCHYPLNNPSPIMQEGSRVDQYICQVGLLPVTALLLPYVKDKCIWDTEIMICLQNSRWVMCKKWLRLTAPPTRDMREAAGNHISAGPWHHEKPSHEKAAFGQNISFIFTAEWWISGKPGLTASADCPWGDEADSAATTAQSGPVSGGIPYLRGGYSTSQSFTYSSWRGDPSNQQTGISV